MADELLKVPSQTEILETLHPRNRTEHAAKAATVREVRKRLNAAVQAEMANNGRDASRALNTVHMSSPTFVTRMLELEGIDKGDIAAFWVQELALAKR